MNYKNSILLVIVSVYTIDATKAGTIQKKDKKNSPLVTTQPLSNDAYNPAEKIQISEDCKTCAKGCCMCLCLFPVFFQHEVENNPNNSCEETTKRACSTATCVVATYLFSQLELFWPKKEN